MGIIIARNGRRTKTRVFPHTWANLLRLAAHDRRRIVADEVSVIVAEALQLNGLPAALFKVRRPYDRQTRPVNIFAADYARLVDPLRARFRSGVIADVLDLAVDAALLRRSMPLIFPQPGPA